MTEAIKSGNWGLKILALILALIIYHALKPQSGAGTKTNDGHIFQAQ